MYRDFAKVAAAHLRATRDELRAIELTIEGSRALVEDTQRTIAHLDRLSRWRVGAGGK